MGQVAPVREAHADDLVTGLHHREVRRHVCLAAGVGATRSPPRPKIFAHPIDRETLRLVDDLGSRRSSAYRDSPRRIYW